MMNNTDKSIATASTGSPLWLIVCIILYLLNNTTRIFSLNEIQDIEQDVVFLRTDIIGSIIGRIILAISLIYMIKKRDLLQPILKSLWPLLLLFAWALASVLWSEIPDVSFKRWIKSFIFLALVINIFQTFSPIVTLRKALYSYTWICAGISLILIILLPKYGWMNYEEGYLPCGIFGHKNSLGMFAAGTFLSLCFLIKAPSSHRINRIPFHYLLLFSVLLIELLISRAMDPLGGFCLAIAAIFFLLSIKSIHRKRYFIPAVIFFVLSLILLLSIIMNKNIFEIISTQLVLISGKDLTFTGRVDIWEMLLSIAWHKHPLIGNGYDIFFLEMHNSGAFFNFPWIPIHAHNLALQIFLELGLIGVMMLIINVIAIMHRLLKLWELSPFSASLCTGFFIFFGFFNMFEVTYDGSTMAFFIFICMYSIVSIRQWNSFPGISNLKT